MKGVPLRYLLTTVVAYEGDDCLQWPYARDTAGYGNVWFEGRVRYVSRIICEMFHGSPPTPYHEAAHNCGKGHEGCVSPRHLAWKTHTENMADKVVHGTDRRGVRTPSSKLTEADVREIKALRGKLTQAAIGAIFGVAHSQISNIFNGKAWRHI